jgi:aryl-alcohol dehydrogenase-like predicted oxidoreductase
VLSGSGKGRGLSEHITNELPVGGALRYRTLGKSGLSVSELCFGAMTFVGDSGWRHVGELGQHEADSCIGRALDAGINFFDTADIYSSGESERILGKALAHRRQKIILATKVGFRMGSGAQDDGCSRQRVLDGCHASLRRLGTDVIDLYQIHSYDPLVPLEETLGALNDLVQEGKIRFFGCSNFAAWQLMKAMSISRERGWSECVSLQAVYSLVIRDLEHELVPLCLDQEIAILPWGPLAGGFLTGKYRRGEEWPSGTRIRKPGDHLPFDEDRGYRIVEELIAISSDRGCLPAQVALRYLLSKPGVTSLVFGFRSLEQLRDNLDAPDISLTDDDLKRLDEVSRPPALYPQWYFDIYRKERFLEAERKRQLEKPDTPVL